MGLLDKLNDPTPPRRKTRCRMGAVLSKLSDDERTRVNEIMESLTNLEGMYSANWLAQTLNDAGHQVNHQSVLRHARKKCCCES